MGLNQNRLIYIRKGYLNQKDLAKFLGVGRSKGRQVYSQIVQKIEEQGQKVDSLGVRTTYVLSFLELTENDIRRFAEDEIKEEKGT